MTDHTPNSKVSRLEVVSTGARRRWTLEEKQRIVAESYGGARLVSVVGPVGARGPAERGCRAGTRSCGDRLSVGSGTDVRTAAAVVASCAARKRRNNRD